MEGGIGDLGKKLDDFLFDGCSGLALKAGLIYSTVAMAVGTDMGVT